MVDVYDNVVHGFGQLDNIRSLGLIDLVFPPISSNMKDLTFSSVFADKLCSLSLYSLINGRNENEWTNFLNYELPCMTKLNKLSIEFYNNSQNNSYTRLLFREGLK